MIITHSQIQSNVSCNFHSAHAVSEADT